MHPGRMGANANRTELMSTRRDVVLALTLDVLPRSARLKGGSDGWKSEHRRIIRLAIAQHSEALVVHMHEVILAAGDALVSPPVASSH